MNDVEPLSDEAAEAVLATLRRHGVRFVLIGGYAIQLHGVRGIQRTADIDVTPDRMPENLERLAGALNELRAQLRGSGLPPEGMPVRWHGDLLARMDVAVNLITPFGPLDLAMRPAGTDGYDDLVISARPMKVGAEDVPTAALSDIIRSKQAAGRPKDALTLPALVRHDRDH